MDFNKSWKIRDSYGPASEIQIVGLESYLNTRLPEEYRVFLLRHNGGCPESDIFPLTIQGNQVDGVIQRFLSIGTETEESIWRYLEIYNSRIPRDLIPIAYDPGGNLILLGISSHMAGHIFFWDHESEAEVGEEPSFSNVYFTSEGFSSFMQSLKTFTDGSPDTNG